MNLRLQILCPFAIAIFIAGIRLFSFNEPPEWDIGTYLVVGHELNSGARLYSDVWDSKAPGIFFTYALAERITGYVQGEIYFLSVLAAIVTMLGVYHAASVESKSAGLWAAILFACVCFEPTCGANLPNTEVFINAAIVWAIALLLHMRATGLQAGRVTAIGLLLAIASLYKQVAVAPAVLLAIAHVLFPPTGMKRTTAVLQACVIGIVGVVVWSLTFAYFASTQRGRLFYDTMFVYPHFYSTSIPLAASDLLRIVNWQFRFVAPLAGAAVLVLLPRPSNSSRRNGMILIAAAIGTYLAIIWPRHFWDHYYQLWLPILAIGAGWGIARLTRLRAVRPWLGHALGAVVALALIVPQISWFTLDGEGWARRKYAASLFARARDDAKEISALLLPDERFYTWSDEAWMYFALQRRAPAAGLWKHHTLDGPLAEALSRRTVEQLAHNPPEMLVDWENIPSPEDHPIAKFLHANYRELNDGKTRWPFKIYLLRGSALERRLESR